MSKRVESFRFLTKFLNNNKKQKIIFLKVLPVWDEMYRPTPKLLVETFLIFFLISFCNFESFLFYR